MPTIGRVTMALLWSRDEVWNTNTDPGFVDAAGGNFQLRKDAEVFKRLPGFQPIPFDRIGPRREELK